MSLTTVTPEHNLQKLGPTVEIAHPESMLDDEEMCKILPFLALPDGAHMVRNLFGVV